MPRALPIHLPTKRIALGKSLGPMTTRATTTTSNNSVGATSNIQLASPQEEGSELVVLVGRRRHRRDVGSAMAFDMLRRSEEHTSELQSLMRISYAVFCLKK